MNASIKVLTLGALGLLLGLMYGCASSVLVDKWHDPSYQAPPLTKMLVIDIRKNVSQRRIWEDAFTAELGKRGVTATASYTLFPDAAPDTDQVTTAVQTGGFDGILVILRRPTETNKQYIQGYTSTQEERRYSFY